MCDYGDSDILPGSTDETFTRDPGVHRRDRRRGAIPIIMGGDHGITWPVATAVADAYGYGKVGIVHFDAHADTAPDMRGNLAGHGTPMRRLIESGAVPGRNFVQVGLRGYWPDPPVLQLDGGQRAAHALHGRDPASTASTRCIERAIDEALDQADYLYLSVDVDACDPAYAPGTGTPEPGGMTSAEMLRAIRRLSAEVGIVGMDVVEVSPPYDSGNSITALLAHRCIREALTGTAMRRLGLTCPGLRRPPFGRQRRRPHLSRQPAPGLATRRPESLDEEKHAHVSCPQTVGHGLGCPALHCRSPSAPAGAARANRRPRQAQPPPRAVLQRRRPRAAASGGGAAATRRRST